VEEVNKLAAEGMPFRDAYKTVGMAIERGEFEFNGTLNHTHEGSIGNLCNDKVKEKMCRIMERFGFDKVQSAIDTLLK
jgi:argininosuccinate lyase